VDAAEDGESSVRGARISREEESFEGRGASGVESGVRCVACAPDTL
jgi:hypothetical protein